MDYGVRDKMENSEFWEQLKMHYREIEVKGFSDEDCDEEDLYFQDYGQSYFTYVLTNQRRCE